jgi:hypothetical protein
MRGVAIGLLLLTSVVGCASNYANLQRETARTIGTQVLPSQVEVFNVSRGLTSVTWHASAQGRSYACSADDMVKRPYCVEGQR